jgi:UPF0716 protein FxsA
MNVAKWLLLAIVGLPLAELAVFIAVAATIGFAWALMLVLATSLAGALVLRLAGGSHIARIRGALNQGSFTMLQADGAGAATLLAGILLLIPGFITDLAGVLLLIGPVRRCPSGTARTISARGLPLGAGLHPSGAAALLAQPCSTIFAMLANRRASDCYCNAWRA